MKHRTTITGKPINHRLVIYSKTKNSTDLRREKAIKSPRPRQFGPGGDKFGLLATSAKLTTRCRERR